MQVLVYTHQWISSLLLVKGLTLGKNSFRLKAFFREPYSC